MADAGPTFARLLGESEAMRRVFRHMRAVAELDVSVLLVGESGTGKELIARELHGCGPRRERPFIAVNTGAIPQELVASELFGHEKGAFTGATFQKRGKFEQAHTGTLFLDEISSMDKRTQVSLLRILERRRFYRVGGARPIAVDVRIIAATNEDLKKAVREKRFREDLYYRFNVFRIAVPPLRDRDVDILLLATTFLRRYGREFHKPRLRFSRGVADAMKRYPWPGNVRELEHAVMRMALMADGDLVSLELLPDELSGSQAPGERLAASVGMTLEESERLLISRTIGATRGNKQRAAAMLGISRKGLYNKLRRYRIAY